MRWILIALTLAFCGCRTTAQFTYHSRYGDVRVQMEEER